ADQILSPTYTMNLAQNVAALLKIKKYGLYHMSSKGSCSWYEFTREILRLTGLKTKAVLVKTDDSKAGVVRPRYSVLSKAKLTKLGLNQMRHWRENLKVYLREKGYLA
ncbi:MAG: sugar nucleotide-binding protein, partial [Candidatus Chisholmbacteria bacterium]|nr:sugar nucleotide-binding protein [Candidatus Chisholmbacteria bacterium]